MLATLAKPVIFPHMSVNISLQTSPHTFLNTYQVQSVAINLALLIVNNNNDNFEFLDSAPTKFQLKLKEAMHINWEKPNLNQQVHHVNLTLTL